MVTTEWIYLLSLNPFHVIYSLTKHSSCEPFTNNLQFDLASSVLTYL